MTKTHEYGAQGRKPFTKAVFLLRNPFKALLSEFNRRSGGHLGHAPSEKFTNIGESLGVRNTRPNDVQMMSDNFVGPSQSDIILGRFIESEDL